MKNKLQAVISFIITFYSGSSLAEDRVNIMDIINDAPKCYVLTEMLNIYSTDSGDNLEKIFVNYSNASRGVLGNKIMQNTVALMFNKESGKIRKLVITDIAESGLDLKSYREIYDKLSCDIYTTIIDSGSLELETGYQ